MLIQQLPASIYVNTDQLNDMKKFNKVFGIYYLSSSISNILSFQIKSYVPVYVDVEMPTSKAEPIIIFIYNDLSKAVNITLPIHLRYHSPSDKK